MSVSPPPARANWAWFLDIDGTLTAIADTPRAVVIDNEIRAIVAELRHRASGAVALVSGRPISDIDALFGDPTLPVAGQHGNERRDADGRVITAGGRTAGYDRMRAMLTELVREHPDLVLEDKGLSLALHYRLAPELEGVVEGVVSEAHVQHGEGFLVQGGKLLREIVPVGQNKGTAVEAFMAEPPFRGRCPAFLGDDVTDEHAFMVVNRLGGCSIKVGRGETIARFRLADVSDVHAWLASAAPFGRPSGAGECA